MESKEKVPWCVFQIGRREHYSIVRAITSVDGDCHLYTDYWKRRSKSSFAPARLRQRNSEFVDDSIVESYNTKCLMFEGLSRFRKLKGWQLIEARNEWFQKESARLLLRDISKYEVPPVVFAYSYAALGILQQAKSLGCKTILGQIDPGPAEFRLVKRLHEEAGLTFDENPSRSYWDKWKRECDIADSIIVNSRWSYSALMSEGIDPDKISIVPLVFEGSVESVPEFRAANQQNYRSTQQFRNRAHAHKSEASGPENVRILFLGQVVLRKGALELIGAIEALAGKPVEWIIVGQGDPLLLEKLQRLPNTRVVGAVSGDKVADYYQSVDTFILPTHSDGFALTQLEAVAYGLPIIASNFCGQVVEQGVTGELLNEVSVSEIVRVVVKLLDDPSLLQSYRENVMKSSRLTYADLAERLMEIDGL